ncbi:MAG TPA: hypothetical protein VG649_13855, partial [Candidatus Angelobacter sp.]|nr:hypothetical protein [Candidatus Angelobacter sp.]
LAPLAPSPGKYSEMKGGSVKSYLGIGLMKQDEILSSFLPSSRCRLIVPENSTWRREGGFEPTAISAIACKLLILHGKPHE